MTATTINIGLAFLEGIGLVISPCIYPILPIMLSASLTGNKKRPIGIIISFILIFSLFTFFSRQLTQHFHIDLSIIRNVAYALLIMLSIILFSSRLSEKFNRLTQRFTNLGGSFTTIDNKQGGFFSGLIFGSLIAFVWTPCAGPILAAVIVQTISQETNLTSLLVLFSFSLGAAIPMFLIVLFGRNIVEKFSFIKRNTNRFRKILALIILLSVFYMIALEHGYSIFNIVKNRSTESGEGIILKDGVAHPYPAPKLSGITSWINTAPLTMNELKGKVVLVDFWAYSCINCVRTIPYLNEWNAKYHDKGLVIIGVQSPEFDFEKNTKNLENAVEKYGIRYPVAMDDHFETWKAYNNQYWPAHYLIDKNGNVVYTHFGEGGYHVTENNIRYLLGLHTNLKAPVKEEAPYTWEETPETYLGYARSEKFESPEFTAKDKIEEYSFPTELLKNAWALRGFWRITPEKIISERENAAIKINFYAEHVYAVMGSIENKPIHVAILLDGKKIHEIIVNHAGLYPLISMKKDHHRVLTLVAHEKGLEIYTFTFGG